MIASLPTVVDQSFATANNQSPPMAFAGTGEHRFGAVLARALVASPTPPAQSSDDAGAMARSGQGECEAVPATVPSQVASPAATDDHTTPARHPIAFLVPVGPALIVTGSIGSPADSDPADREVDDGSDATVPTDGDDDSIPSADAAALLTVANPVLLVAPRSASNFNDTNRAPLRELTSPTLLVATFGTSDDAVRQAAGASVTVPAADGSALAAPDGQLKPSGQLSQDVLQWLGSMVEVSAGPAGRGGQSGLKAAAPTPATMPGTAVDPTRMDAWITSVAGDLARLRSPADALHFRLHPANLGAMEVAMSRDDGQSLLVLRVETIAAQRMLADAKGRLFDTATGNGVDISDVRIELGTGTGDNPATRQPPRQQGDHEAIHAKSGLRANGQRAGPQMPLPSAAAAVGGTNYRFA